MFSCVLTDGKNNDSVTKRYDNLRYVPISKSYTDTIIRETKTDPNRNDAFYFGKVSVKMPFPPSEAVT